MSRVADRAGMTDDTRIRLLESDVDLIEPKLNKILWTMVGLLISVSTACLLLLLNLGFGGVAK